MNEMDEGRKRRSWFLGDRLSLHFRLTLALLFLLVFLFAAGLFAIVSFSNGIDQIHSDPRSGTLTTGLDAAERESQALTFRVGILMLFGLGTVLLSSVMVSRAIRRPLKELKKGAEHFAAGDLDFRVPVARKDEMGEVIDLFNSMASALQENQKDLSHQAFHDTLTGLPNRSLFQDRLAHAMARQGRDHKPLAVLLIDLDDFKTVNDSLGHAAGDQLLMSVAESITSCLRPADTAARLGGDEFAVLVEDMRGRRDALNVAERILRAFTGKLIIEGKEVFVHGSVGIAISYGQEESEELLRNADVAMYAAKAKGKGRYEVFDIGMHEGALARLDLKTELQTAAERREFQLYYQPLISLATGRIVGAEALLRWEHPIRGFIPPLEFIPLAEETGLILDIGRWVLEEACLQTNYWQMAFDADFKISVNLSGRQLQETDIVDVVTTAIAKAPIAGSSLTLEITESVLMRDTKATVAKLSELRKAGVHLAIDDFGTGYSSLGYLREFPVGVVKIDKSFTDGIAQGPEDSALARAIIKLAETLGMETIAEGIETDEQVRQLINLGCTVGQGEFFSPAVHANEFESLLSAQAASGWPGSSVAEPVFPA